MSASLISTSICPLSQIRILKLENEYLREQARGHHPHPRHDDFYQHQHQHRGGHTRHDDPQHLPSIYDTANPGHPRGRANTYAVGASKGGPTSRHMATAASDPSSRTSPRTRCMCMCCILYILFQILDVVFHIHVITYASHVYLTFSTIHKPNHKREGADACTHNDRVTIAFRTIIHTNAQ